MTNLSWNRLGQPEQMIQYNSFAEECFDIDLRSLIYAINHADCSAHETGLLFDDGWVLMMRQDASVVRRATSWVYTVYPGHTYASFLAGRVRHKRHAVCSFNRRTYYFNPCLVHINCVSFTGRGVHRERMASSQAPRRPCPLTQTTPSSATSPHPRASTATWKTSKASEVRIYGCVYGCVESEPVIHKGGPMWIII
jgi:hypothetical protein